MKRRDLEAIEQKTLRETEIAPRWLELSLVAMFHSSFIQATDIEDLAEDYDRRIRVILRGASSTRWRRDGRLNNLRMEFDYRTSVDDLNNLRKAVGDQDNWRFLKSWERLNNSDRLLIKQGYKILIRSIKFEEMFIEPYESIFPFERRSSDDELRWFAFSAAIDIFEAMRKNKRVQNRWKDKIAFLLCELWSELNKMPIKLPRYEDGTSQLRGTMIAFLRDVYNEAYPQARVTLSSTATWSRILKPALS